MAGFKQLVSQLNRSEGMTDLLVIGGGINGAGIAADASGRGLSVVLVDSDDWGHATSSASTKLIHGGLRYLEQYEFRLVRESLQERQVLMHAAPHIVKPLEFHLVHSPAMRPFWMIWLGMKLYDGLAGTRVLPASASLRFDADNSPLKPQYKKGFRYADCRVDDARLVLENVMQASSKGAWVASRTKCTRLVPLPDSTGWDVELTCQQSGETCHIQTRCVVNAAGPWADQVDGLANLAAEHKTHLRLVKGSHIVVPALYEGGQAYLLQLRDGRVIFTIPYQDRFTMIGTTDEEMDGDPGEATISQAEVQYLCDAVSDYFTVKVTPSDVIWDFAGVRPLEQSGTGEESASQASRDYKLNLTFQPAPLLSVYGGKLTSYRALSESVVDKLRAVFPSAGHAWTATATLPGAPVSDADMQAVRHAIETAWPDVSHHIVSRWLGSYGVRAETLLDYARVQEDGTRSPGPLLGPGLHEAELNFLRLEEWAETADDILWRRSKLGLVWSEADTSALIQYLDQSKSLLA